MTSSRVDYCLASFHIFFLTCELPTMPNNVENSGMSRAAHEFTSRLVCVVISRMFRVTCSWHRTVRSPLRSTSIQEAHVRCSNKCHCHGFALCSRDHADVTEMKDHEAKHSSCRPPARACHLIADDISASLLNAERCLTHAFALYSATAFRSSPAPVVKCFLRH